MTRWQDDPDIKAAIAKAAEWTELFQGAAVVREAEFAMDGIHPACVVHGEAESHQDADLIYRVLPELAQKIADLTDATLAGSHGGHGWTTRLYRGPGAANAASALVMAVMAGRLPDGALQVIATDPILTDAEVTYLHDLADLLDGQHFPAWWRATETSTPVSE